VLSLALIAKEELAVKSTFHVKLITLLNNIIISFITFNGCCRRGLHVIATIYTFRKMFLMASLKHSRMRGII
jgi:hypothetical protein